jgi:mannose-1-phosphate guanylyltransferase
MKAFILAAGLGTRLRPLTNTLPKCLLPIRGAPLLQIWLENCRAAVITEVLVNAHAHAEKVKEFAAGNDTGVKIHVVEEEQLLGSAGTLAQNREFVAGESEFFVLYGDVLTNANLRDVLAFHQRKQKLATLGICQVPDPSRCGIVTTDEEGTVCSFVEKPKHPSCDWAFSGIMVASPRIIDLIPAFRPADIGFDLLPQCVEQMAACKISGYLQDIGTLHNYHAAQDSWPGLS